MTVRSATPARRRRRVGIVVAAALAGACSTAQVHAGPVTPATRQVAVGPSGEAMPVGNLPGWRQTFTDDFTDSVGLGAFPASASAKWDAYPSPWKDTSSLGRYDPEQVVTIAGGRLNQNIHTVNGVPLVSALIPKVPGTASYGQTYGRYAIRFRSDSLPGYKMAWMLWPDSGRQLDEGEIDYPERNLYTSDVWAFVHRRDAADGDDKYYLNKPYAVTAWHTAVIEWSPNLVVISLDGQETGRTTVRVPSTPMHWVLQTEVSLTGSKPAASVAGNVQIDWIAAWAYSPSAGTANDTAPPTVSLGAVANSTGLKGAVRLSASASDPSGIKQMKWYVDGVEVAYDGASPWGGIWDTERTADGRHLLWAKAADNAGNWGTSRSTVVTVDNP